jgi:4-amino-4-deoxy-L-arabinose transferase-like glycosyltransferase
MSITTPAVARTVHAVCQEVVNWSVRFRTLVFGDRVGYTLFLGSLAFLVCTWRLGIAINDNYTLLNTLVAVERGHLHIETAHYGGLSSPGTHVVDGTVYGRNYGQVFLALPFLLALRGLATLVYPSVAIAAGWSLLLLALSQSIADLLDRPRLGAVGGSLLALLAFAAGVATAYPIAADRLPVIALQFSSIVVTAFAAVLVYRLVTARVTHRAGVAAAVAYAAVLPTGFWASIPKRHALTTALLFASLYLLHRAREADRTGEDDALRYRTGAYVPVGLTAWVHAPEGFLLLVAVGVADLLTARTNAPRELAAVAAVLSLSLLPFFLTNYLVAGNPIQPPRFTPAFEGTTDVPAAVDLESGGSASAAPVVGGGLLALGTAMFEPIGFLDRFADGFTVLVRSPERVVDTFLLSDGFASDDRNMAILESAPVLGGLVAVAFGLRSPDVQHSLDRLRSDRPRTAVDTAAVIYAALLVLLYMPSLPLHAQITVRYLLPLYPLALLVLVETPVVRTILDDAWQTLVWTYVGGVLLGSQLLLAGVVLLDATPDGGVQLTSRLALGIAVVLAAWTLAYSLGVNSERSLRLGAVLLGLAAAAGTAFLLVSAWYYFPYGPFALPFVPGS